MATLQDLMIRIKVDPDGVRKGARKAVDSLDRQFRRLDNIAGTAIKTMSGLSGIAPLALGAVGGVVALSSSFLAAGAAAGVFGAVLTSTIGEVKENATKFEDLSEKIRLYGRQAELAGKYGLEAGKYTEKQAKAMLELEARLSLLPPAERRATMAFIEMKNSWLDFVDNNKPTTFGFLQKGYALIGNAVDRLQPLFNIGAQGAGRLLDRLTMLVNGGFIERLVARAAPAMNSLVTIIMNLGVVFSNVFGKMGDKQGQKMLNWIEAITGKWAAWATSTEKETGINKFIDYMAENGAKTVELLGNIATAAINIVKALAPFAPISAAVATALSAVIAAIPPDVITTLVTAYLAWAAALKIWAAYQAIATAVQWAQNAALLAWPGTWIILGILALIAVIVLIATKTKWFQQLWGATWELLKTIGRWFAGPFADFFVKAWQAVWDWMKGIGAWFAGPFASFFVNAWNGVLNFFRRIGAWFAGPFANFFTTLWNKIRSGFSNAYNWVTNKWNSLILFLVNVKKRAISALSGIWDGLRNGFKSAVNWIIGKWNNISFRIPSINVLGQTIGGGTIDLPNIPQLAKGAMVRSRPGGTLVNVGEGGEDEAVVPLSRMPDVAQSRSDRPIVVQVVPGGEQEFRRWVKKSIRVQGAF